MGHTSFPGLSFIIPPKSTNCVWNRDGSPEGNQIAVIRRKKNRVWAGRNNVHHKEWCGRKSTGLFETVQISNLKSIIFWSNPAELPELMGSSSAAAAKSLQSCPILCDPIDGSHQAPPSLGFSKQEHWSGLPFPSPMHENEKWKWSRVWLLAAPWTVAHQVPLSMGFPRQEYWREL